MVGVVKLLKFLPLLVLVKAVPLTREAAFIGEGTNELASALLEGHLARNENLVFSPLGYGVLLAIFGEGARGVTREEIATALHLPSNPQTARLAYQATLKRLAVKYQNNVPEMRNWFYVYKNYTVDDDLKDILREYYLTNVKSVERPQDFLDKTHSKVKVPAGLQGKPTDHLINVDKEVESIIDAASSPHKSDGEEASSSKKPAATEEEEEEKNEIKNTEEKLNIADEVKTEELPGSTNTGEKNQLSAEDKVKVASADNIVEEIPQPEAVEATVEDISQNPDKQTIEEKPDEILQPVVEVSVVPEDTEKKLESVEIPLKSESETAGAISSEVEATSVMSETPVKVSEESANFVEADVKPIIAEVKPIKAEVTDEKDEKADEMMIAMQRSLSVPDDMSGLTDSVVSVKGKDPESQMVVFNGLYFRGDWHTQFTKRPADDARPFYKANNEKVYVKTLHAEGSFPIADIPELNSRALELKYEGGRYSLLLVIPKTLDGLEKLTADLSSYPISRVSEQLSEKLVDLCLPTFEISTISKPVSSEKRIGLAKIQSLFDGDKADLTGLSSQEGLFVEELVQFVSFQVDSNFTEANYLTASLASSRSDLEPFRVNQPFLFYLRDVVDDIIIVNGKVVDPTPPIDDFKHQSVLRPLV